MSETATQTIQTQPTTTTETATVADLPGADAQADTEPAPPADGEPAGEQETKQEPQKELVSERYAKAAAAHRRAQESRREAERLRAEVEREKAAVAAERAKIDAIKKSKGIELLRELGIDPEEHLAAVLTEGKPDPLHDVTEVARQAKAETEELKRQLAERQKAEEQAAEQARVRHGVEACAQFVLDKADEYPHTTKLLEPLEIKRAIYLVHQQAVNEGLSLTFDQVAKAVELRAKATYEDHEKRRMRFAAAAPAAQSSDAGLPVKRPVTNLTNKDASQTATVGSPEKTREQRKKELIAELEARAAADKR